MSIEKMHTDASGVKGPDPKSDKTWLNTLEVVDGIVVEFTNWVLENATKESFPGQLDFQCRRLNNLFLGISQSDKYSIGPWNAPDEIGDFVLRQLQIDGESRTAVRDAFMIHAAAVIDIFADAEDTPEESWKQALDGRIALLRSALLGIPREFTQ